MLLNSISRSFRKVGVLIQMITQFRGGILLMITADYRAGVQNGQKSDDVLSTIPMRYLFAPIDKFEMQGFR